MMSLSTIINKLTRLLLQRTGKPVHKGTSSASLFGTAAWLWAAALSRTMHPNLSPPLKRVLPPPLTEEIHELKMVEEWQSPGGSVYGDVNLPCWLCVCFWLLLRVVELDGPWVSSTTATLMFDTELLGILFYFNFWLFFETERTCEK